MFINVFITPCKTVIGSSCKRWKHLGLWLLLCHLPIRQHTEIYKAIKIVIYKAVSSLTSDKHFYKVCGYHLFILLLKHCPLPGRWISFLFLAIFGAFTQFAASPKKRNVCHLSANQQVRPITNIILEGTTRKMVVLC